MSGQVILFHQHRLLCVSEPIRFHFGGLHLEQGVYPFILPSPFLIHASPFCLLPYALCLLPSPFSLLPSAFCLLPSAFLIHASAFSLTHIPLFPTSHGCTSGLTMYTRYGQQRPGCNHRQVL